MSFRSDLEEQEFVDQFRRNLRRRRLDAGMSIRQVADRAELSRTTVSLFEAGKRLPRIDTMIKLAGALGVEPGELLGGIAFRAPEGERPAGFYVRGRKSSPP